MTHGSLFSGIGGFDLAAEWMGWQNIFHCEWNPFGQKILKHYWPDAISYGDITKTDFTVHRGQIDIVTGGFPCQPYSVAGKRKGKEDDRHLWPQMLRAIGEIQPRWVVGENVPGLLNWNGGMVLDEIKADLEAAGFEVFPPLILPACGKDAPHRRDRLWIVAHSSSQYSSIPIQQWGQVQAKDFNSNRENAIRPTPNTGLQRQAKPEQQTVGSQQLCDGGIDPNTSGAGRQECNTSDLAARSEHSTRVDIIQSAISHSQQPGRERGRRQRERFKPGSWNSWPTVEPSIRSRDDGIPAGLDGITFPKWRNESIKGYGNSVVPQVVYEIFKAIDQVA